MSNIRIHTVREFIDWSEVCYAKTCPLIDSSLSPGGRPLFFRGHRDVTWELRPSVFRKFKNGKESLREREIVLDYKQAFVGECDYAPHIERMLVEMQHHEIPTRLLDWSLSPLAALYFACHDAIGKDEEEIKTLPDGKVYALNPWRSYNELVKNSGLHKPPTEYFEILKRARMLMALGWTHAELQDYATKNYFHSLTPEELSWPLPIVGRYMDDRVRSQQGCFVVWGKDKLPLNAFKEYTDNLRDAIIPCDCKPQIIQELAHMGINAFTLFPDREGFKKMIDAYGGIFRTK